MLWCKFYNNREPILKQKPKDIYFKSYKSLWFFVDKYKHYGGINQFSYEIIAEIPTNESLNKLKFDRLFEEAIK